MLHQMGDSRRILVVQPNWIGDAVMATPTLRAIRELYPDAQISYLLRRYVKPVYTGMPWADKLITYRTGRTRAKAGKGQFFDLAARARQMKQRGEIAEDLDTKVNAETPLTFPNGCHIAEVEIDPATGALELAGYAAVDDCGNALNAMIVEGQTHGSIAQGLGQAMMEHALYDASAGQLVTGSFMDYAMPRADDLPAFKEAMHLVPARTNPLGVKGAGEAGTTAAIAALMNAVADAIPDGAGAHLDMPATPEKLWRACRRAAQK